MSIVDNFKRAIDGLTRLEYLNLSFTLLDGNAVNQNLQSVNSLIIKLLHLPSLIGLDLSKNRLHPDNVVTLLRNISIAESIDCLIMSSVHSLNDETAISLIDMIR